MDFMNLFSNAASYALDDDENDEKVVDIEKMSEEEKAKHKSLANSVSAHVKELCDETSESKKDSLSDIDEVKKQLAEMAEEKGYDVISEKFTIAVETLKKWASEFIIKDDNVIDELSIAPLLNGKSPIQDVDGILKFKLMGKIQTVDVNSEMERELIKDIRSIHKLAWFKEETGLGNWVLYDTIQYQVVEQPVRHLEFIPGLTNKPRLPVNASSCYRMFCSCSNTKSLDFNEFYTDNIVIMKEMFYGCKRLTNLNLATFNTERVLDFEGMFANCNLLSQIMLESFCTKNATSFRSMFANCWSLFLLNLASFSIEKLKNMEYMFENCRELAVISVTEKWDINHTILSTDMFSGCKFLRGYNPEITDWRKAIAEEYGGYFTLVK